MKQLLSIMAITLIVITGTTAYGRNYTPYPADVKRAYVKGFARGCNKSPKTNRRFCLAAAKCVIKKAEYNISFKEFWKVNMRIIRTGRSHQPLKGYAEACFMDNAYLLF